MRPWLVALAIDMGLAAGLVVVAGVMGIALLALGALGDDALELAAQLFA